MIADEMEKPDTFVNLHYLPICMFAALPAIFLTSYIIAVSLGHVVAGFPYISDTGTVPPESCIFGQLLNMTAVLLAFVVYVRYAQVKELLAVYQVPHYWKKYNKTAMIIGFASTLGMSIVANFQETSVLSVHLIGAVICFGGGTIYIWLQAIMSYKIQPLGPSPTMIHVRLALSMFCTFCFFATFIGAGFSANAFHGENTKKWKQDDGGWGMHIFSSICEWSCAIAICVYILTFTNEFREIQLSCPKVIFKADYARKSYTVFSTGSEPTSPTIST